MIALALSCLAIVDACADNGGRQVLTNGAIVEWQIDDEQVEPTLGLDVPAFAEWARSGFGKNVTVEMHSNALAVIDAWELAFYRLGDGEFERPLRRYRGDARSLDRPVRWNGAVGGGPPLRPGETVVARLSVRDVAGNISHSTPQEILVARYRMRAGRRATAATDRERARLFKEGVRPASGRLPLRGRRLTVTVKNWPDDREPRASGKRFHQDDDAWIIRQILPPGHHDVVIQSTRRIIGGIRAVPVGIVSVEVPGALPFQVAIKGTAKLVKIPFSDAVPDIMLGHAPEWTVLGGLAISRTLTNRASGEDRLAMALLSADRRVPMARDDRMRRLFLSSYGGATLAWPAGNDTGASGRIPAAVPRRRMTATFVSPRMPEIFLPHTDVVPDSLILAIVGDELPLTLSRDYFLDAGEGRILLGNAVLSRFEGRPEAILKASYAVSAFVPEPHVSGPLDDGGRAYGDPWIRDEPGRLEPPSPARRDLLGRVLDWFRGNGRGGFVPGESLPAPERSRVVKVD